MKNLALFILIAFALSCHKKAQSTVVITDEELRASNYIPAKVVLQTELDGCGFMLALEDGKMLEPANLNDTLKQDRLRLWVKYHTKKNAMSVCMMGIPIVIDDVKYLR